MGPILKMQRLLQKQGRKEAYSCERKVLKVLIDTLVCIESTGVMYYIDRLWLAGEGEM